MNDPRGLRAIASLADGEPPLEALLADGGSRRDLIARYSTLARKLPFPLRIIDVPGSVAESREASWSQAKGDVIAFLDTDEVAPAEWLDRLVRPLSSGQADFSAGPVRNLDQRDAWDRYHARLNEWFYQTYVRHDVVYAPMGNTAWRRAVFEDLRTRDGHVFDHHLSRGGEDFDVTVRALAAGHRGVYVPEAHVFHDYGRLKSVRAILRKKYQYAQAEFLLARRHRDFLRTRLPPRPDPKPWHPIELLEPFVRVVARIRSRRLS